MKTLVIYCHPSPDSFAATLRDAAMLGLLNGRHDVRLTDLYADEFDPVLSQDEFAHHLDDPSTKPGIASYVADLAWCESLILVYPTWWAGQPAMLKGWIDRVWVNGVAWQLPPGASTLRPLLRNVRRITVVTTHGSSKLINALEGEGGKRMALRSIRLMCSRRCRTRWIALYNIDRATPNARERFIARVSARLER